MLCSSAAVDGQISMLYNNAFSEQARGSLGSEDGEQTLIMVYLCYRLFVFLLVCAKARDMSRVAVELSTYFALYEGAQPCYLGSDFLELLIYVAGMFCHAPGACSWPHVTSCRSLPEIQADKSNAPPDIQSVMHDSGAGTRLLLAY
jgi:hypothetical protein